MSNNKPTPGPWKWFTNHTGDNKEPHIKFLMSKTNNQGFAHTVGLSEPEDTANANLIAAAPELLVSLKEMRDVTAALMRAISNAQVVSQVMELMPSTWEGFGKRADVIILKAETYWEQNKNEKVPV